MNKLILKWRPWKIDTPMNFWDFSLNGWYTLSFRYNGTRKWYVDNAWVKILDQIINPKYLEVWRVSLQQRKDKCFAIVEFDETKITSEDLSFDLTHDFADYGVNVLTKLDGATFLRDFTTCTEWTANIFTIRDESTDPITQAVIPAYILNLT